VNDGWRNHPYGINTSHLAMHALYFASEIGPSKHITSISFYVNNISNPATFNAIIIRMRNSTKTELTNSDLNTVINSTKIVHTDTITAPQIPINGWLTLTLKDTFSYSGSNLEVFIESFSTGYTE
jgi:xanthine dehydrogenase molybdopterin-binding subunit B